MEKNTLENNNIKLIQNIKRIKNGFNFGDKKIKLGKFNKTTNPSNKNQYWLK